jgi:hypothetical protein
MHDTSQAGWGDAVDGTYLGDARRDPTNGSAVAKNWPKSKFQGAGLPFRVYLISFLIVTTFWLNFQIAVILATDGLPTDDQGYGGDEITQNFIKALRSLEGLPIWLVIRLCTDEDKVTDFYNQLDGMLELSLEVLDDFLGECKEVSSLNPWLNYALPMHRCRELGYHDRLFDLIDERPLTKGELRDFCVLLFGTEFDRVPDPVVDWKGFITYVQESLNREVSQWNPLKKKVKPWISIKKLNKHYNGAGCTIL